MTGVEKAGRISKRRRLSSAFAASDKGRNKGTVVCSMRLMCLLTGATACTQEASARVAGHPQRVFADQADKQLSAQWRRCVVPGYLIGTARRYVLFFSMSSTRWHARAIEVRRMSRLPT